MSSPANQVDVDAQFVLAAERTLLAWIRTGIALMGFGFVVARFGLFLREIVSLGEHTQLGNHSGGMSLWIGVVLVILGAMINLTALLEYRHRLRDVRGGKPHGRRGSNLAIAVAVILALLGLVIAGYLVRISYASSHERPATIQSRSMETSSFSATLCPNVVSLPPTLSVTIPASGRLATIRPAVPKGSSASVR